MDKIIVCTEKFYVVDTPEDADADFDPVVWETVDEHTVDSTTKALNEALEFMKDHPNYVLSDEFNCSGGGFQLSFSRNPGDYENYKTYYQFSVYIVDE